MDWREFVETMSVVEQTLRADPGGAYDRMDFITRDRYRHVVEKMAKTALCPKERLRASNPNWHSMVLQKSRNDRRRMSGSTDRQGSAGARTNSRGAPI